MPWKARSLKVVWMGKAQWALSLCKVGHLSYFIVSEKITVLKFLPRTVTQPTVTASLALIITQTFFLFHGTDTIKAKILWYIGSLVKMSALKLTLGERSLATPGDWTPVSSMTVWCSTNWVTSPLFFFMCVQAVPVGSCVSRVLTAVKQIWVWRK